MDMSVELFVWLGMAGLALTSACILLWRTRRVLGHPEKDALAPEVRLLPSAILAPSGKTESASSVIAS